MVSCYANLLHQMIVFRKRFNYQRIGLEHQLGSCRFTGMVNQYGWRDVVLDACSIRYAIVFPSFLRFRVGGRKRFEYATCGWASFWKRRKRYKKISGYVWKGPQRDVTWEIKVADIFGSGNVSCFPFRLRKNRRQWFTILLPACTNIIIEEFIYEKKKINRHEISIFLTVRHAESCKDYLNFTNFWVINFAKTPKPRFLSIRCGFCFFD